MGMQGSQKYPSHISRHAVAACQRLSRLGTEQATCSGSTLLGLGSSQILGPVTLGVDAEVQAIADHQPTDRWCSFQYLYTV